jgi:hypothetical protein
MKLPFAPLVVSLFLAGCDTYPDIADDSSNRPDPSEASNDTFFGAEDLNESNTAIGTLTGDDTIDHYKFNVGGNFNGPLIVQLSGVTGDADIELYDYNLNLVSWSRTQDSSEEEITVWHDAAFNSDSYDVGLYFVRVYSDHADLISDYILQYDFDKGNAE